MKLRAPSIPLITVDPYFSIWAPNEIINHKETQHWTGAKNDVHGFVTVDGKEYSFLGYYRNAFKIKQVSLEIDALSTKCVFENEKIRLFVTFTTPLLPTDLRLLTRPVSYMAVSYEKKDSSVKDVSVKVMIGDSLSADIKGGKDYGLTTVWFNRHGKNNPNPDCVDYEVKSLEDIKKIL